MLVLYVERLSGIFEKHMHHKTKGDEQTSAKLFLFQNNTINLSEYAMSREREGGGALLRAPARAVTSRCVVGTQNSN